MSIIQKYTNWEATMSESSTKLEQILELLLAEDNDQAEAMLHEFVVDKARTEYEKLLDESTDEEIEESEEDELDESYEDEMEETIDRGDQVEDLENDIQDIEDEETFEADDEMDDMDDDEELVMGDEEGEDDLEDKVEDLEAELEDLRAEFEKLMADEDGEGEEEGEMDIDMNMDMEEPEMESFEYDLDEAEEVDEDEELEEATQFSKKVADPKGGAGDADASAGSMKPAKHTTVSSQGKPVHASDGGDGKKDHGGSVKDHTPTDNIDVEPKKA